MNDSKLIKMLRTFTDSEIKEFEKFVDSPYFSRGRDLSNFFKTLKPFYPEFEDKKLTGENVYLKLYPGKKYEDKKSANVLHKLSSDLYKLCRDFLIHDEFKNDEIRKYFYLLNKLRMKKLYSEFDKEYKNAEAITDNLYKGGVSDFLDKYYLRQSFLEYSIDKSDVRNVFDSILTLGEYSVIIALIKGFRNIDTNSTSKSFNVDVRYNLVDNFIKHLDYENLLEEMKANNDRFYPYAAVSNAIHEIFADMENIAKYFELKNLIISYISLFGHTEKYILFQTLISYCSKNIDGGNRELFIREEFENFKMIFELGIYKYSDNDKIQINNFRSIISCAIDNGEIDWLENFIENYITEILSEHQGNMRHYSFAYVHFARKNFEKALECIMKVKFNFILFKMDVKNLMFKIYYELGYFEQAYSMLDTMRHYIANTNELSELFKIREKNFIKYAGKLLKIKSSDSNSEVNYLEEEIKNETLLGSRNWLINKIAELK